MTCFRLVWQFRLGRNSLSDNLTLYTYAFPYYKRCSLSCVVNVQTVYNCSASCAVFIFTFSHFGLPLYSASSVSPTENTLQYNERKENESFS